MIENYQWNRWNSKLIMNKNPNMLEMALAGGLLSYLYLPRSYFIKIPVDKNAEIDEKIKDSSARKEQEIINKAAAKRIRKQHDN